MCAGKGRQRTACRHRSSCTVVARWSAGSCGRDKADAMSREEFTRASGGQLFASWLRVTNRLDRCGFTL